MVRFRFFLYLCSELIESSWTRNKESWNCGESCTSITTAIMC